MSALLGKGTSGRIYRAVLEDSDGEETDVAVKILRDEDIAAITLKRFRDEAELVAQVRDRAIVWVEPPVKLADGGSDPSFPGPRPGKWAMVMDLVTGASLQRLTSLGAMPPSVATEIVREVARVLERVWRATGNDGQRLRILHKDIKPSNLQLSVAGAVRVLDFGIAKADYKTRDAQVSLYGTGTRGFIAPERLDGTESPAGDVFSLGVTAHTLIGGDRPFKRRDTDDPDALERDQAMIALFNRMRSPVSAERPTAIDVEAECSTLLDGSTGMTLREWAERNVPRAIALKFSDEVVGTVLTDTSTSPRPSRAPPSRTPPPTSRVPESRAPASRVPEAPKSRAPESRAPLSRMAAPPMPRRDDDEETVVADRDSYLDRLEPDPAPLPSTHRTVAPTPAPQRTPPRAPPSLTPLSMRETEVEVPVTRMPPSLPPASSSRAMPSIAPPPTTRATPPTVAQRATRSPPSLPPVRQSPSPAAVPQTPAPRTPKSVPPPPPASASRLLEPTRPLSPQLETVLPEQTSDRPTVQGVMVPFGASLPPSSVATPMAAPGPLPRPSPPQRREVAEPRGGFRWFVGVAAMGLLVMAGGMVIGVAGGAGVWWMWPNAMVRRSPSLPIHDADPVTLDGPEIEAPLPPPPRTLTFSSIPLGADVYIDREPVGQTPVTGLVIPEGTHEVILVSDFERLVRPIQVGKKQPVRYVWKGGHNWELHF